MNFILDADIQSFFDTVSQEWLIRFVEHRIGDKRIIRQIQKWLKAGVLEDGVVTVSDRGTGQGAVISPLLANVYLHYALDLWAERWRRREATGDMIIVRYADDIIVGCQYESDARRFLDAMRERLRGFSLSLHPDKTRLIEFGRFAAQQHARRGLGKPETFKFLGFTFICGQSRRGRFLLKRKSAGRPNASKAQGGEEGDAMAEASAGSRTGKMAGPSRYAASSRITQCRRIPVHSTRSVTASWTYGDARSSDEARRDRTTWERIAKLADDFLPKPRILHPWPHVRFADTHPRWEPSA